jgi:FkbM family methyltransferase
MLSHRFSRAIRKRIVYPTLSKWYPLVQIKTPRGNFKIDLRDHVIARVLFLDGEYEPEFQQLFEKMELAGGVCVDIGANLGLHTIALGKLANQVFAFEPSSHNYSLLQKNVELNGLQNVQAIHAALGDQEGFAELALSHSNFGDHQILTPTHKNAEKTESVKVLAGDQALATVGENKIKLIKIDVQGYEYHVLEGLKKTFDRNPDAYVMLEVAPKHLKLAGSSGEQVMSWMKNHGFFGWEFDPYRVMPVAQAWAYDLIDDSKYVNILFCRREEKIKSLFEKWRGFKVAR